MCDEATAPWLQLTLEAIDHAVEQLEDALLQAGALAVTLEDGGDQPVLEPAPGETPLWAHTRVTGLFDAQTDIEVVKRQLRRFLHVATLPECRLTALEERDWVRAWMDNFHPMRFGQRLWICPTAQTPPAPDAVNIRLDPGLAFGTGTHPTTAMCLRQLDGMDVSGKTVIDYGCGSGILGIAALLLGAKSAIGIDIDPQALVASRANTTRNNIAAERFPVFLPGRAPSQSADIVLANILAGPLVELAAEISALVAPEGQLILSGILHEQQAAIRAAYPDFLLEMTTQEEWACLSGRRR